MKKKISALLFAAVLCLGTVLPVLATEDDGFADRYYRVLDMAELLSDDEESALIEKLDEISVRQSMDVVVATVNDTEGFPVQEYTDLFYEQCGFGYGSEKDGLMLLISMEERDYWISTCGYGVTAFTDAGIDYIRDQIKPSLSDGSYAAAFDSFAELCDDFITQARNGEPYDRSNLPREPLSIIWIPIALVIGFVLAKIIVGGMKGKLKSVRAQSAANSYVKENSMSVTECRDLFLYQTVTRTAKPKNNSSGSSTHKSSSGTVHGGGGGKF